MAAKSQKSVIEKVKKSGNDSLNTFLKSNKRKFSK